MANAISYPLGVPKKGDYLLGTSVPNADEDDKSPVTRNFDIASVSSLVQQGYVEKTVSISNSQWLGLAGTSVEIIPAPGAGKVIQVILAHIKWVHSGANFQFNQSLTLGNGTSGAVGQATQATMPSANYTDIDSDSTYIFTISGAASSSNGAINFGCVSGATITGGGTLSITVRYQII
jgi:hypothetical protein